MAINIEKMLTKFKNINDFDFEDKKFRTNVKHIAPKAYLNILYDAAEDEIQKNIIAHFPLPKTIRNYYSKYNGARLLSRTLYIYGFHYEGELMERSDWRRALKSFDLIKVNKRYFNDHQSNPIFFIGYYGVDASRVFVERSTEKIYCCVEDDINNIRASWNSFEEWITQEIPRLTELFDENGVLLVDSEKTLPNS